MRTHLSLNMLKAVFNFLFIFFLTKQYGLEVQGVYTYYTALISIVFGLLGIKTEILLLNRGHRNDETFPSEVFTAALILRTVGVLSLLFFVHFNVLLALLLIKFYLDVFKSLSLVIYRRSGNINKFNFIESAEALIRLLAVGVFPTIQTAFAFIVAFVIFKSLYYYFDVLHDKFTLIRPKRIALFSKNFVAGSVSTLIKKGDKLLIKEIVGYEVLGQYSLYAVFLAGFTDFLKFSTDFNTEDYDKFSRIRSVLYKLFALSFIPLVLNVLLLVFDFRVSWVVNYFGTDYLYNFIPITLLFPILVSGVFPGINLDINGLYIHKALANLVASILYVTIVFLFYNGLTSLLYYLLFLWSFIITINFFFYFKLVRT
jgi:hypothetical protein